MYADKEPARRGRGFDNEATSFGPADLRSTINSLSKGGRGGRRRGGRASRSASTNVTVTRSVVNNNTANRGRRAGRISTARTVTIGGVTSKPAGTIRKRRVAQKTQVKYIVVNQPSQVVSNAPQLIDGALAQLNGGFLQLVQQPQVAAVRQVIPQVQYVQPAPVQAPQMAVRKVVTRSARGRGRGGSRAPRATVNVGNSANEGGNPQVRKIAVRGGGSSARRGGRDGPFWSGSCPW
eukprot:Rmarinus@m.11952